MRLIPVLYLREGSTLALDILNEKSIPLLKKGMVLNEQHIDKLNNLGIFSVYITDQYCTNTQSTYTAGAANVLREVILFKKIAERTGQGLASNADLLEAFKHATTIVNELDAIKDTTSIVYEPKKLKVNDFEERTIYTALMSVLLALKAGYTKEQAVDVCIGALLRDIALVSPRILADYSVSDKNHPKIGFEYMKKNYALSADVLRIILEHHECYDGTGFPNRLSGEQISPLTRIVSIIDLFYELKTKHMNAGNALLIDLFKKLTAKLDPMLLDIFLNNVEIYTPDTLVRLSNGDIAVVISNSSNPFNPVVSIIDSLEYPEGKILDLEQVTNVQVRSIEYYVD